ncbi:MAG: 50S ribosome-binding GTPase [Candidatus Thermoplasmatota archaeon]|nr:50S ribosome-binding GTPase [Candidatus Thermoplasmatota archaeon]
MTGPKLGLIGKPNVGKSTIFSAMTEGSAEIGNYPFTTTKPNLGVAYFPVKCPHTELGTPCNPREGYCREGTRYIPVRIIDVPGLIEGASQGKGMGNEFLENVRDSDAILLIYDASGHTAMDGSAEITAVTSPEEEIRMVLGELDSWLVSKLGSDWDKFARKADSTGEPIGHSIQQKLSSYGVTLSQVHAIIAFPRATFLENFFHGARGNLKNSPG